METKKNFMFLNKETDGQLKKRVEMLVKVYLIKNRKRLIENYIVKKISKFMGEDRLLTSEEVMNMLQISRQTLGRRIKAGILNPVNPEAKRNYRFKKSDVVNHIERKEVNHG
jgi:predicted DNA-binding transcriptional regulator AlpA